MDYVFDSIEHVPQAVLSSLIQEYSKDPQAQIVKSMVTPFSTSGVSGNNTFYRADIEWQPSGASRPGVSTSLLIKRWTPGGISQSEIGWSKPAEALAWRHGILQPASLPEGLKTPIVGSMIEPNERIAWIAMTDVSKELQEFDRSSPLPPESLISHTKAILSCLARFHAFWEQPDQQQFLRSMTWLLPFENYVRRNSAFYANILNPDPTGGLGQADIGQREEKMNVQAFLDWAELDYRPALLALLVDRTRLVESFADLSWTLLHGDLDDRNIGLSWSASGESELVLIDWEWMGCGPAAIDVAKLLIHASMMVAPGSQCSESCWSDELPEHYYESYRLAGGKQIDHKTWCHTYDLALVAQVVWPYPTVIGSIIRAVQGDAPLPIIPGISQELTRELLASGLENRKSMVATIKRALHRHFFNQ